MNPLRFTEQTTANGIVERDFSLCEITGVLWSPASGSDHATLVLMGHGGGLHKKTAALLSRAHHCVTAYGYTVVAIDPPGHGDRPRSAEDDHARAPLRQAMTTGDNVDVASVSFRYV